MVTETNIRKAEGGQITLFCKASQPSAQLYPCLEEFRSVHGPLQSAAIKRCGMQGFISLSVVHPLKVEDGLRRPRGGWQEGGRPMDEREGFPRVWAGYRGRFEVGEI